MSLGQLAKQSDRLQMIRVVVDAIRVHCQNPLKTQCEEIAKSIVAQYPRTFGDEEDGVVMGNGYEGLLRQIKTRVSHVNRDNTLAKI